MVRVIARTNGCRHNQAWPALASAIGLRTDAEGSASSARVQADVREPTKKVAASNAIATGAVRLDCSSGDAGSHQIGDRQARLNPAVCLDQPIATDDRGNEGGLRDPLKRRGSTSQQSDHIQLAHREYLEDRGGRDRCESKGVYSLRCDEDWFSPGSVQPDSGRQPDQNGRRKARRSQQTHLEGRGMKCHCGGERQCQQGELIAEH